MEQEPLLFIKSPYYFAEVGTLTQNQELEESTSVFVKENYVNEQKTEQIEEEVDEYVLRQFQFLRKPFRQKVYQPLLISLKDGRKVMGTASDVHDDSLMLTSIELRTQEIIHIEDVLQILWRGRHLPTL